MLYNIIKIKHGGKKEVFFTDTLPKVRDKITQLKKSGGTNKYLMEPAKEGSVKIKHIKNKQEWRGG